MRRIADAGELEAELRRLLRYVGTKLPSRSRIANELQALSARLAGQTKQAATLDLHSEAKEIMRAHQRAEADELKALLAKSVPYFRSNGFDLNVRESLIDKEWHGSDGWRLTGQFVVTEREENSLKARDWEATGHDSRAKQMIRTYVQEASGIYTFPRKGTRPDEWICEIDES